MHFYDLELAFVVIELLTNRSLEFVDPDHFFLFVLIIPFVISTSLYDAEAFLAILYVLGLHHHALSSHLDACSSEPLLGHMVGANGPSNLSIVIVVVFSHSKGHI